MKAYDKIHLNVTKDSILQSVENLFYSQDY
jgi:hypothetical protein